jgi:hypothetical protein
LRKSGFLLAWFCCDAALIQINKTEGLPPNMENSRPARSSGMIGFERTRLQTAPTTGRGGVAIE